MKLFDACVSVVLVNEGGWVDDPNDSGGETYAGMSRRFNPSWQGWPIIDKVKKQRKLKANDKIPEITNDMLSSYYFINYWNRISATQIGQINPDLAMQVFDMAVNSGVKTASKLLQRCCGTYQDGIIGYETLGAIPKTDNILDKYLAERRTYYQTIATGKNSNFLAQWLKRITDTQKYFNNTKID